MPEATSGLSSAHLTDWNSVHKAPKGIGIYNNKITPLKIRPSTERIAKLLSLFRIWKWLPETAGKQYLADITSFNPYFESYKKTVKEHIKKYHDNSLSSIIKSLYVMTQATKNLQTKDPKTQEPTTITEELAHKELSNIEKQMQENHYLYDFISSLIDDHNGNHKTYIAQRAMGFENPLSAVKQVVRKNMLKQQNIDQLFLAITLGVGNAFINAGLHALLKIAVGNTPAHAFLACYKTEKNTVTTSFTTQRTKDRTLSISHPDTPLPTRDRQSIEQNSQDPNKCVLSEVKVFPWFINVIGNHALKLSDSIYKEDRSDYIYGCTKDSKSVTCHSGVSAGLFTILAWQAVLTEMLQTLIQNSIIILRILTKEGSSHPNFTNRLKNLEFIIKHNSSDPSKINLPLGGARSDWKLGDETMPSADERIKIMVHQVLTQFKIGFLTPYVLKYYYDINPKTAQ